MNIVLSLPIAVILRSRVPDLTARDLRSWLLDPWWSWDPATAGTGDVVYRWFNLAEAGAWFVFATLALARWGRNRRSGLEVAYALAFVAFGLTDVREAWEQSAPLFAVKGLVLAVLLTLRWLLHRRHYPESRLL